MARINSNNTNLLNIQDYHQRKLFAKEKQVTPNGKYRVFFFTGLAQKSSNLKYGTGPT